MEYMEDTPRKENEENIPAVRTFYEDLRKASGDTSEVTKITAEEVKIKESEQKQTQERAKNLVKKSFHLQSEFKKFKQKESEFKKMEEKKIKDEQEQAKPSTEDLEKVSEKEDDIVSKQQTLNVTEEDLIVEKNKLSRDWKDFEVEKDKVHELGLRVKDIRTLKHEKPEKNPNIWKNVWLFLAFLLVLIGSVAVIVSVFLIPKQEIINPSETQTSVTDALIPDKVTLVDVSSTPVENWRSALKAQQKLSVITKFTPFKTVLEQREIISLEEFLSTFSLRAPNRLISGLGQYYFVGQHKSLGGEDTFFLILSSENPTDVLSGLFAWERFLAEDISSLFNTTQLSYNNESAFKLSVLQNQNIRLLQTEGRRKLAHYQFGRLVVIVLGDIQLISEINQRIRNNLSNQ